MNPESQNAHALKQPEKSQVVFFVNKPVQKMKNCKLL